MISRELWIIGAGVIGLTTAWRASQRGYRVRIFDPAPAKGAMRAAGGMITPLSEIESIDQRLFPFSRASAELYPRFAEELERESGASVRYRQEGMLWIALHRDHMSEIERAKALHRIAGTLGDDIDQQALRDLEPSISPRAIGAYRLKQEASVDPIALASALLLALQKRDFCPENRAISQISIADNRVTSLIFEGGENVALPPHADVLVAAGAQSTSLLPEILGLRLRPVAGLTMRLHGQHKLRHVMRTPEVYVIPHADREVMIGASSEEVGFDSTRRVRHVHDLLRETLRVAPGLDDLDLADVRVGFRPALRDNLPAIGRTAIEGLHVALGHYRHGILLAPWTAQLFLDGLDNANATIPDAVNPARFAGVFS